MYINVDGGCTGSFTYADPLAPVTKIINSNVLGAAVKLRVKTPTDTAPWITPTNNGGLTPCTYSMFLPNMEYEFMLTANEYISSGIETRDIKENSNNIEPAFVLEPINLTGIVVHGTYSYTSTVYPYLLSTMNCGDSGYSGVTVRMQVSGGAWTTLPLTAGGCSIISSVANKTTINLEFSKSGYITEIASYDLSYASTRNGIWGPVLNTTPTTGTINFYGPLNTNYRAEKKNSDNSYTDWGLIPFNTPMEIPVGTTTVRFSKFGYTTRENQYTIPDNAYKLPDGTSAPYNPEYLVTLVEGTVSKVITTSPIGATIEYSTDGKTYTNKGVTTSSGLTITVPGSVVDFYIRYSKTDYISVVKMYNNYATSVTGIPTVSLNPITTKTSVFFDTSPTGVTITKSGVVVGTTPCTLVETTGTVVSLTFSKTNYVTRTIPSVTFSSTLAASGFFIYLTPVSVTATITTTPSGVKVEQYDGLKYTTLGTTPGISVTGVINSSVTLRYSLAGYVDKEKTYTLTSGLSISETLTAVVPTTTNLKFLGMTGIPPQPFSPSSNTNYGAIVPVRNTIQNLGSVYSGSLIVQLVVTVGGNAIQNIPGVDLPILEQTISSIAPGGTGVIGPFNVTMSSAGLCTARMRIKPGTTGENTDMEIASWDVYSPGYQNLIVQSITFDKSSYTQGNSAVLTVVVKNTGTANSEGGELVLLSINGSSMNGYERTLPAISFGYSTSLVYNIDTGSFFPGSLSACVKINNGDPSCASSTIIAAAPTTFSFTITSNPIGGALAYYNTATSQWTYYSQTAGTPLVVTRPSSAIGTTENWFIQKNGYQTNSFSITYTSATNGTTITRTLTPSATAYAPVLGTTVTVPSTAKVGDSVTITGTLTNTGGTAGSSSVWATIGGSHVGTPQTVNVAAGSVASPASSPVSITFVVPNTVSAPNQYQVCLSLT